MTLHSAFELYADLDSNNKTLRKQKKDRTVSIGQRLSAWMRKFHKKTEENDSSDKTSADLATVFKDTFSRKAVRVHFVGAWYVFESKTFLILMPLTKGYCVVCWNTQGYPAVGDGYMQSYLFFPSCPCP
jgi:hypothetical protein